MKRAAEVGARGIKLKLVKNLGPTETVRLANFARELGLLVVFGNGVATDVGNLAEFLVLASAPDLFNAPSESSGCAKLIRPVFSILEISDGNLGCRIVGGCQLRRSFAAGADLIAVV